MTCKKYWSKGLFAIGLHYLFFFATACIANSFPSFESFKTHYAESEGYLLDRDGITIQQVRLNPKLRRLAWTETASISPVFLEILKLTEDKRFLSHSGVDWWALAHAGLSNALGKGFRGASTLTMQLSELLKSEKGTEDSNSTNKAASARRKTRKHHTLLEKWQQIQSAKMLEQHWTKNQILEAYVNLASFRGEFQGIRASSQALFHKEPLGLERMESVILSVLIRSPQAKLEAVKARACALGLKLSPPLPCHELMRATEAALTGNRVLPNTPNLAPHLARELLIQGTSHPSVLKTTLVKRFQELALSSVQKQVAQLRTQNVHDGAALIVENATGNVLAYVGSVGEYSDQAEVDGVKAYRQAGSTLKPFLYALGIEKRILTANTTLLDTPTEIPVDGGVYRPQNYDQDFHGRVSLRVALASSLNVPAVKSLQLVGNSGFLRTLKELGFSELRTAEDYGMSLALGSADVRLWELVNAYRTLALGGIFSPLRLSNTAKSPLPPFRVFTPETSFIISDILSDPDARRLSFGSNSPLNLSRWAAVKTGTSKDMRDNWCVGFNQDYTVGVWLGNFSGEPMWNVSGVSGAAPAWAEIMEWLQPKRKHHRKIPSGLELAEVELLPYGLHSHEWFIKGTTPSPIEPTPSVRKSKILYPTQDLIVSLDPDIPKDRQRLFFKASAMPPDYQWQLNGITLNNSDNSIAWEPTANGRYNLSLIDGNNNPIDTVQFSVRGE